MHAIADEEQVLASAFADRAIRRKADAFREAEALGFRADELARQIVAGGLGHRRNGVRRHALPGRDAHVHALGLALGAEVLAPFPGGDGHFDRRVDLRRDADLAVTAERDRAQVGAVASGR